MTTTLSEPALLPAQPDHPVQKLGFSGIQITVKWHRRAAARPPQQVLTETMVSKLDNPRTLADALCDTLDYTLLEWQAICDEKRVKFRDDDDARVRAVLQARNDSLDWGLRLIMECFNHALSSRSAAWAHQLTRNFIATLDTLTNTILGYTSQPEFAARPQAVQFDLERNLAGVLVLKEQSPEIKNKDDFRKEPFEEDGKNALGITYRNIANIYHATDNWVMKREAAAFQQIKRFLSEGVSESEIDTFITV